MNSMEQFSTEELKDKIVNAKRRLRTMVDIDPMKVVINFIEHYQNELKRRGESI